MYEMGNAMRKYDVIISVRAWAAVPLGAQSLARKSKRRAQASPCRLGASQTRLEQAGAAATLFACMTTVDGWAQVKLANDGAHFALMAASFGN